MACRFSHGSATPTSLDLTLIGYEEKPTTPVVQHQTDSGTILQYVIGTTYRRGTIEVMILNDTERTNFKSFVKTARAANSRFTFMYDATNFSSDSWSAYFISEPSFKYKLMPAGRIVFTASVDIQDVPVSV